MSLLALLERLICSLVRPCVTRLMLKADSGEGMFATQPAVTMAGPSGRLSAHILPAIHGDAASVDNVTWDTGSDLTPREIAAVTTLSAADFADLAPLADVVLGVPQAAAERISPQLVAHLAEALVIRENQLWADGAGSVAEPILGVGRATSISTVNAGAGPTFNALSDSYFTLLEAGAQPNAASCHRPRRRSCARSATAPATSCRSQAAWIG